MTNRENRERLNIDRRILEESAPVDCWATTDEQCRNPTINAHSIQEKVLEGIADNSGKVLTVMPRNLGAATNPHREKFDEVHIGTASRGQYSCLPHDGIFSDVESKEPNWDDSRETFLLAFRSVLYRDYLARQEQNIWRSRAAAFPSEKEAQEGAQFIDRRQALRQHLIELMHNLYHAGQYDYLEYHTRETRGVPTLAASTTMYMRLEGGPLDGELSFASVTVYPKGTGHIISAAYPKKAADHIESEFQAFSFREDSKFEERISEFNLMNPYNTFLSPVQWRQFSQDQKQTIEQQILALEFSKQRSLGIIIPRPQAFSMINLFKPL